MKSYFDRFYEIIHKNSVKRRRMVSLLLVLSVFVSSGVLWELRDTVITMVNEPLCGLDQHKHTDECYETKLICGQDESEDHIHTDECYEKVLICGQDEHWHTTLCFGDEELTEADMAVADQSDDNAFAISNILDEYDAELGEELLDVDFPELTLDNGLRALASEAEQNAPYMNPNTLTTIDNIAEGIKFTLFDYGGDTLESQNNNYNYRLDSENEVWTHPNANTTDGINAGRNAEQDILFLAYGTPVPEDTSQSNDYAFYNYWTEENGVRVHKYKPDKNSYSGDYESNPVYSGNRPVSGIVDNILKNSNGEFDKNGYPTVNASEHHSLAYLFNDEGSAYKTVYHDVNHLLQRNDENGHLIFDSNNNYAYYDKETGDFIVYDTTFPVINKDHHKETDIDYYHLDENEEPTKYNEPKPEFMIGFFPFDEYDPARRDPNFDGNGYNHHFGMKMEAKFVNPSVENLENGEPVSFKYSGDDDMWVFVDGKLVLDIGGIHEPTGGMIDFTNGLVWVQDNELGKTMAEVELELISAEGNGINNENDFNALPKPIGTDTTGSSENKWLVTPLTQYLGDHWDDLDNGKKQEHEIKMFYLERGGCYSNLAMEMNLPTLKPLSVKKEVEYQDHLIKDASIDDKEYEFQVWEWIETDSNTHEGTWVKPDLPETTNGYFKLRDGDRMTFDGLEQHRKFKITEVNVDPNVYDQVSVNGGTPTQLTAGGAITEISSSENGVPLSETNSYTFNNRVIQEKTKLKVIKDWDCDPSKKPADFTMKYRIMRTDSVTGEVKQVALQYTDGNQVKKRRVFTLEPENHASGYTHDGLLSRYGNHIYSYDVEELNVPFGFKASYSDTYSDPNDTDSNGKQYKILKVTNTDVSEADIYVKKEWKNTPPNGQPAVKLVLKRERVGYSPSQSTSLRVNILDEGGNLIKTETFDNLYANGSAEIYYDLPEGVELYRGDLEYPMKKIGDTGEEINLPKDIICGHHGEAGHTHTDACYEDKNQPDQSLYVKFEEDEYILVVQNLATKVNPNDPDEIANEVTFKVTSDNADDSLLLLHHSFTRGTNGWTVQNDMSKQSEPAIITPSQAVIPYAKGDTVVVANRTKSFNGAVLYLDPAKFKANKTYTFSTYVYHAGGEDIPFVFTFNDGLNKANYQSFKQISRAVVPSEQWTPLTGTVTLPAEIDPYNMFIIVETENPSNDSSADNYEAPRVSAFYMDEFTAVEGTTPVSVSQQIMDGNTMINSGGVVTVGVPNEVSLLDDNFTSDDCGWRNHFEAQIAWENEYGGRIHVSDREGNYTGAEKSLAGLGLVAGQEYTFSAYLAPSNNNETFKITLYNPNVNNSYISVGSVTMTEGGNYEKKFTIPNGIDPDDYYVYVETDSGKREFDIYAFGIRQEVVPTLEDLPGYDESTGQYVSDYSNYGLSLDTNSVTNPLHLAGDYTLDPDFHKEITLPITSDTLPAGTMYDGMGYHWDKNALEEDSSKYLYRYWIEEETIGGQNVVTNIILNGDEKVVESTHDDYLISYDRQFVSTNTENAPILVTNKYIWYKLPATGGRGTVRIYFFGSVMTAIGILSLSALYRRRRRRV